MSFVFIVIIVVANYFKVGSSNGSVEAEGFMDVDPDLARQTIEDQKNIILRITEEKNDIQSQLELVQQQVCCLLRPTSLFT